MSKFCSVGTLPVYMPCLKWKAKSSLNTSGEGKRGREFAKGLPLFFCLGAFSRLSRLEEAMVCFDGIRSQQ